MKARLKLPIYECVVHLETAKSERETCIIRDRLLKKYGQPSAYSEDSAWGTTVCAIDNYHIILSEDSFKDWNTFLHELSHCIDGICEDRDVKDPEARAYLSGHVGDYFLTKLINYKNEKNIP